MIKSWFDLWKNIFNYKGKTNRKQFWLATIANVIAMYVFAIPYALIIGNFRISTEICMGVFFAIILTPTVALYFRRANDANWKALTALFMALVCPITSGLIVGAFPSVPKGAIWPRFYSITGKLFALSFGLSSYGGFLGTIFYDDPIAIPILSYSGLVLGTITIAFISIKLFISNIKNGGNDL